MSSGARIGLDNPAIYGRLRVPGLSTIRLPHVTTEEDLRPSTKYFNNDITPARTAPRTASRTTSAVEAPLHEVLPIIEEVAQVQPIALPEETQAVEEVASTPISSAVEVA